MLETETEGVIKYHLKHQNIRLPSDITLTEINTWRSLCYQLQLIGQTSELYQGYAYGNISQRYKDTQFIISGTQTGGEVQLSVQDYCLITHADLSQNTLQAQGECRPSSEALTHASVYQQNPEIHCVIHAHNSEIWQATHALSLPHTSEQIAYGTPEMALAVQNLLQQNSSPVFTMLGHEDGVIAYGNDFSSTFAALVKLLATAKQLSL